MFKGREGVTGDAPRTNGGLRPHVERVLLFTLS